MKARMALLVLLAAPILSGCGEPVAPVGSQIIYATRLYTAPDEAPIDDAAVVVRDGVVVAVGTRQDVATDDAARIERCDAGVLVAGFQNSHVHFTESQWQGAAEQSPGALEENLAAMLTRFGFTTAVDTASQLENTIALRARIDQGDVAGPRIITAGEAVYPHDGIPIYLRDMPPEILSRLSQPATVEDALAAVRANLDGGADVTKLFVMTPQGGGGAAFMDRDIARAAAEETHRSGLLVLAHPTDIEGLELAIETSVDVLVHTTLGQDKTVWPAELVERLVSRQMAVIPTLKLWPYELERAEVPPHIIELATADAIEQLRVFAAAGGQVLFGTDVGYMEDYDPSDEYRLMAQALTPMQILASLTTAPASRWNEEALRGRIAVGMAADLVVLDEDPADDPTHFARVRCTIRGGRLIHPMEASSPGDE